MMRGRSGERGMILVNVLVIVMLATAVLAIMLAGEEDDVGRSTMLRQSAQGMAAARGAELSAIAALRRDGAVGTAADSLDEEWAGIADRDVRIDGGRFSFVVADAQARFNLNNLMRGDIEALATFAEIARAAGIPAQTAELMAEGIKTFGPINDVADTRLAGLSEDQLQRLSTYVAALPEPTTINLNTAPEPLLAIIMRDAAAAKKVVSLRKDKGGLDNTKLLTNGLFLPPGSGYASAYYWSRGRVEMGETSQQLTSLLHRSSEEGTPVVRAIRRWRGAAPLMAPPLPPPGETGG